MSERTTIPIEVYNEDGEVIERAFAPVTEAREAPAMVALRERLVAVETSVTEVATATDAALDPAATPGRKQTLRDRIKEIIEGAMPSVTVPPKTPGGKEKP